MNTIKKII